MSDSRTTYTTRRDDTREDERHILAKVYSYVLACGAEFRKTADSSSGHDAMAVFGTSTEKDSKYGE